jgi:hypothetical protein
MGPTKKLTASQIFSDKLLHQALQIDRDNRSYTLRMKQYRELVQENIEGINARTGQENDPGYLSYLLEYLIAHGARK